ncbi:DUF2306 domain-containing protein [Actinoplanes sp. TRM 88003]|uniref:DUF2306 domain-containing protein n=1 Tax=Paractinoplanes aksuensis TaxID=2939490 RepID=A0ABT1DK14_9ACTN|nr:DUF2306 domain-containing protein [Actinoplanes aksuensis]MCO8271179.1 DUF2306 domain-containing protein [Actinoplanes aksuensis]
MSKLVPAGLIALALVPSIAGAARLGALASGAPAPTRFTEMPAPVVVHIIGALIYSLLGAFQFEAGFRRTHRTWHRRVGRVLVGAGLAVALSGAWMTLFSELPANDHTVVNIARLLVSAAMTYGLVAAVRAVRRRDIRRHRAWMIRSYALALGAGTQAFTLAPYTLFAGEPGPAPRAALMILAWTLNAAVAEWIIRRSRRPVRPNVPTAEQAVRDGGGRMDRVDVNHLGEK